MATWVAAEQLATGEARQTCFRHRARSSVRANPSRRSTRSTLRRPSASVRCRVHPCAGRGILAPARRSKRNEDTARVGWRPLVLPSRARGAGRLAGEARAACAPWQGHTRDPIVLGRFRVGSPPCAVNLAAVAMARTNRSSAGPQSEVHLERRRHRQCVPHAHRQVPGQPRRLPRS